MRNKEKERDRKEAHSRRRGRAIFATIPYNRPYDSPACVTVVMHKDKEENSHHDSHYRARELAALAAYDHHHLDGEMFLQVSARECCSL